MTTGSGGRVDDPAPGVPRAETSLLVEGAPRPDTLSVKRGMRLKGAARLGWLFSAPSFIGLLVFVAIPIVLTAWVSLRDWSGFVSPFATEYIGFENYNDLLFEDGVHRTDFALSIRNNFYYVLFVVPMQTTVAFVLAVILNNKFLKGKGFFRTSYYFPSITSSIAVTLIFLFLFQTQGAINAILPGEAINWFDNANGLFHNALGVIGIDEAPAWMVENEFMGVTFWQWIAGPSVAMFAIIILVTWTTIGTFMLIFLAGLQSIPESVEEAAKVDGASTFQTFWHITIPLMKPTIFFVVTIGLIATWQVFDQIYATNFGGPQKTTLTPAFLTYFQSFTNSEAALGAAIAMLLLLVIMFSTFLQRRFIKSTGER
jgi:multiple sugar transport system permease protein